MKQSRTQSVISGNFNYGVGAGPPAASAATGEPIAQIVLAFADNDGSGEQVEIVMAADNARDLAMKILDQLKKGPIETFPPDVLRKLGG